MEQHLIDANNLGVSKANPGIFVCKEYAHGWNNALQAVVEAAPTVDPEALPIVRQLREELALITHQRDVYKSVFERITAHGDCNDCGKVKECQFAPKCGEDTRYNCPLWRGPQKEE